MNNSEVLPGRMVTCRACGNRIAPGFLAPRPVAAPEQDDQEEEGPEQPAEEVDEKTKFVYRLRHLDRGTLTALLCGSLALGLPPLAALTFLSSPLAVLSKPLSAVGLLIGLLASLLPAVKTKGKLDFPIAVCVLCLIVFLLVGPWPSFRSTAAPAGPMAVPLSARAKTGPQPVKEDAWLDASMYALQDRALRIHVFSVRVLPVDVLGKARPVKAQGMVLVIAVRVRKDNLQMQAVPYQSWGDTPTAASQYPPVLTDNSGRSYPQVGVDRDKLSEDFIRSGGAAPAPVQPANAAPTVPDPLRGALRDKATGATAQENDQIPKPIVYEVLFFQAPPPEVESLRLQLPAGAFGLPGTFRFEIPRGMIQVQDS